MSRPTNRIVEENKYRFFQFYYTELDKYLVEYNSNEIIKTITEEFQIYYDSDEEFSGQVELNVQKEPGKKIKKLVQQVFDNSSRIDFENINALVQHLDKCFRFLIFLKKSNTDIFELFSIRRINNLFGIIQKYNIVLYYSFKNNNLIKELFDLIQSSDIKLINTFLESLLYISYHNITHIRNYEYEHYKPITASHDSNSSNGSHAIPITLSTSNSSRVSSYGSPPKFGSPLSNGMSVSQPIEKPPINTLTLLNKNCFEMYNMIITFVYETYSKCQFWMTREIYNTSLHILYLEQELGIETTELINTTLSYFTKASLLYNTYAFDWNINFYLRNSLHRLKQMLIFPEKEMGSPTNTKKKANYHWIFPLMENRIIKDSYQSTYSPNIVKNNQLLVIDGRNWFYSKQHHNTNYLNIEELQSYKSNIDFVKRNFEKLQQHFSTKLKTNITPNFMPIVRCVFVFNEYHKRIISQYNPDLMNLCVFTPQRENANNDDIFCLYLWLSTPGSLILSNDQYRIYADNLMGEQYFQGLWQHWTNCFQLCK